MGLFSRLRSNRSNTSSVKSKDHMRTDSYTGSLFSSTTSDSSSTSAESMSYNHKLSQPRTNRSIDQNVLAAVKGKAVAGGSSGSGGSGGTSAWKSRPKSQFIESGSGAAKGGRKTNRPISLLQQPKNGLSLLRGDTNNQRQASKSPQRKPPPLDQERSESTISPPPLSPSKSLDPNLRGRSKFSSPNREIFHTPPTRVIEESAVDIANNLPSRSSPLSTSPVIGQTELELQQPPVLSQKERSLSPMSPGQPLGNDSQLSLMLSTVSESVTSMSDPLPTNQFSFNQPHPAYVYQAQPSPTSPTPPQESDSYADEEERTSSTSTVPPSQHPFYEQWKQYYEQLALHQQQYMNSNPSFNAGIPAPPPPLPPPPPQDGNFNPMMYMPYFYNPYMVPPSPTATTNASFPQLPMNFSSSQLYDPYLLQQHMQQQQQQKSFTQPSTPVRSVSAGNLLLEENSPNDYLGQYKKSRNMKNELIIDDNGLVSNSRRSLVKQNRYPSAPFSNGSPHVNETRGRVASAVESTRRTSGIHMYEEEDEDDSKNTTNNTSKVSNTALSLEDRRKSLSRHISDYNKFLFGTEEEDDESEDDNKIEEKDLVSGKVDTTSSVDHQLPTPTSEDGLSRNESGSSAASSCDSIQSDGSGKFVVGGLKTKPSATSVIPGDSGSPETKTKKKPPHLHPYSFARLGDGASCGAPSPRPLSMMPQMSMNSPYASNPVLSQNTEYSGSTVSLGHNRRQSIATTESKRMSMALSGYREPIGGNKRNSVAVFSNYGPPQQGPPRISDVTISKKIDEFIKLRNKIASGQKSLEYRLYWVKMLIDATNFKLYAYINIKGDPIQPEQIPNNKLLFIKSSENHLTKLMKELDNDIIEREGIKCEVYFIYGCLLKQDYLTSYNQDFGFGKDVIGAIQYFEKVLEINSKDFRALYKLGEIYEFDIPDGFERAVQYYTESAKLGYNRAIFKMSMLYLHIPELRSVKYLKYLHNLANIELRDVKLDEEDFDEMEEIIGLASYELGRIYEGVYPGDLSMEDEFIKQSVELAPVNYAKSLTYYNKSARLNCLLAQVRLGIVYEKGELNRQQNPNKSIQWFIKASSSPLSFRRHPEAMVGLARWYLRGTEGSSKYVPMPSPEKAVMWCDRAIKEFNSPDALYFMGELSEMRYTNSNPQIWYQKAYELGHEPAAEKLGYV